MKRGYLLYPILFLALLTVVLLVAFPLDRPLAATLTVNSTGDTTDANPGNGVCADASGNCTLRAAIQEANALAGTDTISFNIAGAGVKTIAPATGLPAITAAVIIDGTSQPGFGGSPLIEINGAGAGFVTGLRITGGSSTVKALVINRFTLLGGIQLVGASNTIQGCYIGTDGSSWKKKPRFVLFAGDASYDPKNYLGLGVGDLVPTKLVATDFLETASDDWLADFDGDGLAEMSVGRLPVRTAEEAARTVLKIVAYESASPSEEILLVADANDGYDFEAASNRLTPLIPEGIKVTQVKRGRVDIGTAKKNLLDGINRGEKLINYTGHGSADTWRGDLLSRAEASQLVNKRLPLFVMMTCLNGYFHDATFDSLGESLLKAEGGAVAVWASSGMTLPIDQTAMNQELYRQLFNSPRAMTLGEAMRRAKTSITDSDIRRTWLLLGDPTMKLR